jgi:hypothetical protein
MTDLYRDANDEEIEVGFLLSIPSNLNEDGKPILFNGIMTCVGRHSERNTVFIRYMGKDMVHEVSPAKLEIITPTVKNRTASLAAAA